MGLRGLVFALEQVFNFLFAEEKTLVVHQRIRWIR